MGRGGLAVAVLAFVLAASGCAGPDELVRQEAITAKARIIAVAPLANLTTHPKAGLIVAELAATQLLAAERFQVIGPMEVAGAFDLKGYQIEDGLDMDQASKLTGLLGANTLLFGSVTEYQYRPGLYDQPAVGLSLRFKDLKTGQIIWAANRSACGAKFWSRGMTLSQLADQLVAEMIQALVVE
ncbi:MAG: DUF799 family lipoprotein [Deltaproteobacteria bacterium]|nr:DUF799 family lipoprotein [Deltaproteobacteria bacterium]